MHGGGALLRSLCALACVCVISTAAIGARVAEVTAVAGTAGVKRRHRGAALAESCPDQRGGVAGTRGTWECKSTGSHRRSVSQEQQQHNLSASNIAGAAHYCHLRRAGAAHTRARVRLARHPGPGCCARVARDRVGRRKRQGVASAAGVGAAPGTAAGEKAAAPAMALAATRRAALTIV